MSEAILRVLVVDDEPLARERLVEALSMLPGYAVSACCANGHEAVYALRDTPPDLVLLDVQMPGLDGFEVIAEVGAEAMPPVIFVTAHDQYALRAFEVAALDYLTKPWDRERLALALGRAREETELRGNTRLNERLGVMLDARGTEAPARLAVRSRGRVLVFERDELDRITAAGNYLRLHVGAGEHLVRDTLESFARRLGPGFLRVHRSHLVRLACVREVVPDGKGGHALHLGDGAVLPVGAGQLGPLLEALEQR